MAVSETIPTDSKTTLKDEKVVNYLPVEMLKKGKYQPRSDIDNESIITLSESIRAQGIIQPIVVRVVGEGCYEIVSGERRWRAAKMAKIDKIPCIIRSITDEEAMAISLIENIDRESMTLVDEAIGIARLADHSSIKECAKMLGKTTQWVSKRIKLSKSPDYIISFCQSGYSRDLEGYYELSKLADKDEIAAKKLIEEWDLNPEERTSLRAKVIQLRKGVDAQIESKSEENIANEPMKNTPINNNYTDRIGSNLMANNTEKVPPSSELNVVTDPKNRDTIEPDLLPPIELKSVVFEGGYLVLKTNEGDMKFEVSEGAKNELNSLDL